MREARDLGQDTLDRMRRVLGDDHPSTLMCANNLSLDLRANGDIQAARDLDQDTLDRMRRMRYRCGGGSLRAPLTCSPPAGATGRLAAASSSGPACSSLLIGRILTARLGAGTVSGHRVIDVVPGGDQRPCWQIAPAGPAPGVAAAGRPAAGTTARSDHQEPGCPGRAVAGRADTGDRPGRRRCAAAVPGWQRRGPAGPVPRVLPSPARVRMPVSLARLPRHCPPRGRAIASLM